MPISNLKDKGKPAKQKIKIAKKISISTGHIKAGIKQ